MFFVFLLGVWRALVVFTVNMGKEDIQSLLVKYICNEASAHEILEVKDWIRLHPENELYFLELYEAWNASLAANDSFIDEDLAYKKFKVNTVDKSSPKRSKWYKLAVLLIVPFLVAAVVILLIGHQSSPLMRLSAGNGAVKKSILPDGTVIWLNAGSTLSYDVNFGKTNRVVYLSGEALFDIGHRFAFYPFLVKTPNFTVKDVGTKFNVKSYPNDSFFEAAVLKGEVSVEDNVADNHHNINRIYLRPRQVLKVFYHLSSIKNQAVAPVQLKPDFNEVQLLDIDSSKMSVYDGWKDNQLVFEGSRLDEIIKVLERKYNVTINIADPSLRAIKYSGNFNNVPSVTKVLDVISQNTPLKYYISQNQVTILKNY